MPASLPVDMQVTHFRFSLANGAVPRDVLFVDACVHAKKFLTATLHGENVPVVHLQVRGEVKALQVSAVLGAHWNCDT